MNKLTLVIMASLCTLLIACNKEEIAADINYSEEIETRSLNGLTVTYTTVGGQDTTVSCTKLLVDYTEGTTANLHFVFGNDTSLNTDGDAIEVLSKTNYDLLVTPTGGAEYNDDDISINVCGEQLCYSNAIGSVAGIAAGFIIEDDAVGI